MKVFVLAAVVMVGLQTAAVGVCTTGQCGAASLGPAAVMAVLVAALATWMSRDQ